MKIFVDIGAHHGETLLEVIKSKYFFDRIYCFEPSKKCIHSLQKIADSDNRVKILNCGLSNKSNKSRLFDSGSEAASIFQNNIKNNSDFEEISLLDTGNWFKKNITEGDVVVVKLNCEGSEVDIIDSLLKSDELKKIYNILITFDVRNFNHLKHKEIETRKKLKTLNFYNYCFSDNVMLGSTHERRIENWLSLYGIDTNISNIETLREAYSQNFKIYSNKTGFRQRLERSIKSITLYEKYPTRVKNFFRLIKRFFGLSRELDTHRKY
jgi:FkbM family methyltransferase